MLPDVLQANLTIVFCGSAVGAKSAQAKAYYAGPGNKFWRTLYEVGLTPRLLQPREYPLLPQYGIGLTDLVKTKAGSDRVLADRDFGVSEFEEKIIRHAPRFVCFNGKKAGQTFLGLDRVTYGLQAQTIGNTQLFVAPSTSGAASGFWDSAYWESLIGLCRAAL